MRARSKLLKILIADDSPPIRRGILDLLANHEGWEVLAEAVNGQDAVEKTASLHPDLVLMDVTMPIMNGFDATRTILSFAPETTIIVVTVNTDLHSARVAKEVGACGFVSKVNLARDLVRAIEACRKDGSYFPEV